MVFSLHCWGWKSREHSPPEPHLALGMFVSPAMGSNQQLPVKTYSSENDCKDRTLGILDLHSRLLNSSFFQLSGGNKHVPTESLLIHNQFQLHYHCPRTQKSVKYSVLHCGSPSRVIGNEKAKATATNFLGLYNKSPKIVWANTTECYSFIVLRIKAQRKCIYWQSQALL